MKVLLISANTEQINMPALPVGMACVAAAVYRAGHEVHCLDLMARDDPQPVVQRALKEVEPDVIGVSVRNIDNQVSGTTNFMLAPVKDIIAVCREGSTASVVLGGAGYSIFPEEALTYLEADMGIRGEGEESFVILLDRLSKKMSIDDVPGLYRPHTAVRVPFRYSPYPDTFPIPLPGVHLYIPESLKKDDVWIPIQSRRGCPMDCSYCSTASIEGRIIRKFSCQRVTEMLRIFVSAGFKRYFFVDNIFNLPPTYAENLCDHIIEAELGITWRCIVYPALFSEKLAAKMARAGCEEVSLGCESGVPQILHAMNKKFSLNDIKKTVNILKQHNIRVLCFLLLGSPQETKETVLESLKFMQALSPDSLKITSGLRIYPNTDLHRTAKQAGVINSTTNLLFPHFYLKSGLEDYLKQIIGEWLAVHPNWFT